MLAYQILQDETCQTCGTPVWIGHNEDNTIVFEVDEANCYSCAELERYREEVRKRSEGRESSRYGITEFVVPHRDMGTDPYGVPLEYGPLPSREEALIYMEQRQRELAAVSAAQKAGESG